MLCFSIVRLGVWAALRGRARRSAWFEEFLLHFGGLLLLGSAAFRVAGIALFWGFLLLELTETSRQNFGG